MSRKPCKGLFVANYEGSVICNLKHETFSFCLRLDRYPVPFWRPFEKRYRCSAFTKQLYSDVFNLDIKSNSRDIFSMVNPVAKDELKEGDLVFFKDT